jgi:hypothetical protein
MKINRSETHDRLLEFLKLSKQISEGFDECMKKNEDSLILQSLCEYVYVFSHTRTLGLDEKVKEFYKDLNNSIIDPIGYQRKYKDLSDVPERKNFIQPRLSIPEVQPNSILVRYKSHTDSCEVIWNLPPEELWDQFKKGNVTESKDVFYYINEYKTNRNNLCKPHPKDHCKEKIDQLGLEFGRRKEELFQQRRLKNGIKKLEL